MTLPHILQAQRSSPRAVKIARDFLTFMAASLTYNQGKITLHPYSTCAASMPTVYLALGTNLGDRPANLRAAIAALPPSVVVRQSSPVYETPPWGLIDQPAFLNMVVIAETRLEPEALLATLKRIEQELGRTPAVRWGPRVIDMDILFYDDLVLETPEATIRTRACTSALSSSSR